MHRTLARPAPLEFPLPLTHSIYSIDRLKELGQPHLPPASLQSSRDGLQTPPIDMATTYQQPQYSSYAARQDATYQHSRSSSYTPSYTGTATHNRTYSTLSQPPLTSSNTNVRTEVQRPVYSPCPPSISPLTGRSSYNRPAVQEGAQRKTSSSDKILPSLQIPKSINNSGASLAEFAAQITCLFWFESAETLDEAEKVKEGQFVKALRSGAIPSTGFKKWVVTILSTTQVTPNVILLALLFIYRLKRANPVVKGRSGSEYRLLTVALMLGNKFLDDNTYTNKTWAEVSGISVAEIHVMEVEFLSNMRYSLLASEDQWADWQKKLAQFYLYCDQAGKMPLPQYSPQSVPILNPALPSPPTSLQSSPPCGTTAYLPSNGVLYSHYPLAAEDKSQMISRKRSFDGDVAEPAAKRVARPATTIPAPYVPSNPTPRHDAPRLPVPNLTIATNSQPMSNGYNGSTNLSQNVPLLPPLNGNRAMASVYPPTSQSWTPQLPMLTPTGPSPGLQSASGYSTPTRRQSPHSVQELLSLGSSPTTAIYPSHNPAHISPSFYLQQRNSPYKPVRHVDTLLYPPSSTSMHSYTTSISDMHYQPLGKRNDYRSGIVPEYVSQTPYQWNGAVLRQPNFHP